MPRRILLLITDLEVGGTPTVLRELATRLHSPPDVEVDVACLAGWGPVAEQLREAGVTVVLFEARGARDFPAVVRQLVRLTRERGYDTVFSFLIHANTVAAAASLFCGGVRFHQSIQTTQPNPRWHWWLQRLIHLRADVIVCPSTAVADVARNRCDVPTDKIVVIPNAINPAAFPDVPVFRDPARIRVGFLGRLDPVKQVPHFVRSIAFVSRDDVRVEGHIFGDGPDRPAVETAIRREKVEDRVFLHGATASPQAALAQMDALYLTSIGEGFGLVLIEAMASGVPVIAFAHGGVTDIIEDTVNGFLLCPDQFGDRQIWTLLENLRSDVDLRGRIIENARATVRKKFTWEVVLPRYRELLRT